MDENKYASRKFIVTCFLMIAAIPLAVTGVISADVYQTVNLGIAGMYIGGNVAQKFVPETK